MQPGRPTCILSRESTQDQLIPANILKTLPASASVLDVGTGTGIFLEDLPESYERIGCDISGAQFAPDATEKGIRLFEHDVTDPFPAEYENRFHLVHMRLLVLALTFDTWPTAVQNVCAVTRPGGHVELVEVDGQMVDILDEPLSEECKIINEKIMVAGRVGNKNMMSGSSLERLLKDAGMTDVQARSHKMKFGKLALDAGLSAQANNAGKRAFFLVFQSIHNVLLGLGKLGKLDPRLHTAQGFTAVLNEIEKQADERGLYLSMVFATGRKKAAKM